MHTVIFETQNATFYFDAPDAITSLKEEKQRGQAATFNKPSLFI